MILWDMHFRTLFILKYFLSISKDYWYFVTYYDYFSNQLISDVHHAGELFLKYFFINCSFFLLLRSSKTQRVVGIFLCECFSAFLSKISSEEVMCQGLCIVVDLSWRVYIDRVEMKYTLEMSKICHKYLRCWSS